MCPDRPQLGQTSCCLVEEMWPDVDATHKLLMSHAGLPILKFQTEPLIFFDNCKFLRGEERGVGPPGSTWWLQHAMACLGMKQPWPLYRANSPYHQDVRVVFNRIHDQHSEVSFPVTCVQAGPQLFVVTNLEKGISTCSLHSIFSLKSQGHSKNNSQPLWL